MFLFLKQNNKSVSFDDLSDEVLVSEYIKTSDKDYIARLFERYTHLVYGICLKYLPDQDQCKDAVMEIFESLFHKLESHNILNFRNWLYSVTKNYCLMIIRKSGNFEKAKSILQSDEFKFENPDFMSEEDDLMFSKPLINSAVDHLNQEQSTCIKLMYIEDKSYNDIAKITGYTLNEIKSHIQNGKRNLKNYLLKQDGNKKK